MASGGSTQLGPPDFQDPNRGHVCIEAVYFPEVVGVGETNIFYEYLQKVMKILTDRMVINLSIILLLFMAKSI